ncbi:hypothetical protein F4677DRAFT_122938 [Hypoxylon crocopeplum]|nr:hypothetical protein F4677DRAFT_122938 [Hypoxylon crocopeplum]
MCPTTLKNDIGQNIATDNAKQTNLAVSSEQTNLRVNNNITNNISVSIRKEQIVREYFSLPATQKENLPKSEFGAYFLSLIETGAVKKMIGEEPPACQRGGIRLPGLNTFRDEIKTHDEENEERSPVLDELSEKGFDTLKQWMGATDYQILLVIGDQGNGTWTTNFLLEIMESIHSKPKRPTLAFTAHLCGKNLNAKQGRQVFLIRDLLGQLIERYLEGKLGDIHICAQFEVTMQEPKAAEDFEVKELWNLFIECIKQAGIRKLIIIIDRIDYILGHSTSDDVFREFIRNLETFCKTLWDDGIAVKLMVISGYPAIASYFPDIKALETIEL